LLRIFIQLISKIEFFYILIDCFSFFASKQFILPGRKHQRLLNGTPFEQIIILKNNTHIAGFNRFIAINGDLS